MSNPQKLKLIATITRLKKLASSVNNRDSKKIRDKSKKNTTLMRYTITVDSSHNHHIYIKKQETHKSRILVKVHANHKKSDIPTPHVSCVLSSVARYHKNNK